MIFVACRRLFERHLLITAKALCAFLVSFPPQRPQRTHKEPFYIWISLDCQLVILCELCAFVAVAELSASRTIRHEKNQGLYSYGRFSHGKERHTLTHGMFPVATGLGGRPAKRTAPQALARKPAARGPPKESTNSVQHQIE